MVVQALDKKQGRFVYSARSLSQMPYHDVDREAIALPKLSCSVIPLSWPCNTTARQLRSSLT